MQEPEYPPVPVTGDELIARWALRDASYARMAPMNSEQEDAIRQGRSREANDLPDVTERASMWVRAQTWSPPRHADYGSLKDFLRD